MINECNNNIIKIIQKKILDGLGKDCIEASMVFDYKINLDQNTFNSYYEKALNCLNESKQLDIKSYCNNEIVKDIIISILQNKDFEHEILPKLYIKYSIHKDKENKYNRTTMRDLYFYYEIAKRCIELKVKEK